MNVHKMIGEFYHHAILVFFHLKNDRIFKIRLTFENKSALYHNCAQLRKLEKPIACINAKHKTCKACKVNSDEFGGLEPVLYQSEGAYVMLTRSIWLDKGLCNGNMEIVEDIIYKKGQCPPGLPLAVVIEFEDYTGSNFFRFYKKTQITRANSTICMD